MNISLATETEIKQHYVGFFVFDFFSLNEMYESRDSNIKNKNVFRELIALWEEFVAVSIA